MSGFRIIYLLYKSTALTAKLNNLLAVLKVKKVTPIVLNNPVIVIIVIKRMN